MIPIDDADAQPGAVRFSELPTFRLDTLASLTSRHGELLYQRLFGLRIVECRVLGVVQAYQPVSLRRACVELGLDKSIGSRIVARLVESGLVQRRDDPDDQRSFFLLLSRSGRALHGRIVTAALQRNEAWITSLTPQQRDAFLQTIEIQIVRARELLDDETRRSTSQPPQLPSHERGATASREPGPLLVQRETLADLHRRLGELLAQGNDP